MVTPMRICSQCLSRATAHQPFLRNQFRSFSVSSPNLSSSSVDPKIVAEAFLSRFSKGQTFVRKQLLDANQLRLFSLALNRPQLWPNSSVRSSKTLEEQEPVQGTPLPPAYHLCYFTPAQLPGILGQDGTDASFNPEAPFTRRMWAGGSFHWPGADPSKSQQQALLRVGDIVTEVTRVLSCEPKVIGKTGEPMLVVGVEKEFRNSKDELCVLDRRNWVFREALDPSRPASLVPKPKELSQQELDESVNGKLWRGYNRTEATLFRFSALTFNAHRIHYDKPWATEVEGHRSAVVHGPMNLLAMLDLWRDEASAHGGAGQGALQQDEVFYYPLKIEYRATNPVYAGEGYRVVMDEGAKTQEKADIKVVSNDGTVCMKGTVTHWKRGE
jgi:hydroxyacyl-ACP dehydratase HTD2-like protein with hotdog domain